MHTVLYTPSMPTCNVMGYSSANSVSLTTTGQWTAVKSRRRHWQHYMYIYGRLIHTMFLHIPRVFWFPKVRTSPSNHSQLCTIYKGMGTVLLRCYQLAMPWWKGAALGMLCASGGTCQRELNYGLCMCMSLLDSVGLCKCGCVCVCASVVVCVCACVFVCVFVLCLCVCVFSTQLRTYM